MFPIIFRKRTGLDDGYDPLSASPTLWIDFSDSDAIFTDTARTTKVTTNGDLIRGALDKSGSGNHASMSVVSREMSWNTGQKNGLAAAVQNDNGDGLITDGNFGMWNDKRGAIVLVHYSYAAVPWQAYCGDGVDWWAFYVGAESSNSLKYYDSGARNSVAYNSPATWYIQTWHRNADASADWRRDGVAMETITIANLPGITDYPMGIGLRADFSHGMNGVMGEFLFFDDISLESIVLVEEYLAAKWNI